LTENAGRTWAETVDQLPADLPMFAARQLRSDIAPEDDPARLTAKSVADRFGVDVEEVNAAKRRAAYREAHGGRDGRTIGTENELSDLAWYAAASAAQGFTKTRAQLEKVMLNLLRIRQEHAPETLTTAEEAFLAKLPAGRHLHPSFWLRWAELQRMRAGAPKTRDVRRTAALTASAVQDHFTRLDNTLSSLDFLYKTGPRRGQIRDDCEFFALPHVPGPSLVPPLGLHRVWNMDETPALMKPDFQAQGVYDPATTAGPVSSGPEHNETLTAVICINLLGQMAMPYVIFPNNVRIATPRLNKKYPFVLTDASQNGYIDAEVLIRYGKLLRSQLGHDKVVLLLCDGHRTRLAVDVISTLLSIGIHLYLIPPYTSHALQPVDQYNQRFHQHVVQQQRALQDTYGRMTSETRLEGLYQAFEKIAFASEEIVAAWKHAGITPQARSMTTMLEKPRQAQPGASRRQTSDKAVKSALDVAARLVTEGAAAATPAELARMQQQVLQTLAENRQSGLADAKARQRAILEVEVDHQKQALEQVRTGRQRVTASVWGDATSEHVQTRLAEGAAKILQKQQAAAARQRKLDADQDLLAALVAEDLATEGEKLTLKVLQRACKAIRLASSGTRAVVRLRLIQHFELPEPMDDDEDDGPAEAAEQPAQVEEDADDDEEAAEPPARAAEDPQTAAFKVMVEASRAAIEAKSAPNAALVQELLHGRTVSMRNWWKRMDEKVKVGYHQ
jgi:hypothetical protein